MEVRFIELMFFKLKIIIIVVGNKALVFDNKRSNKCRYKLSTAHSVLHQFPEFEYKFIPESRDIDMIIIEVMDKIKKLYRSDKILKHNPTIITNINMRIKESDKNLLNIYLS